MIWSLIKRFLFLSDAEKIHEKTFQIIHSLEKVCPKVLESISAYKENLSQQESPVLGMVFKNPLGLAAGFDKNAELLSSLWRFGFGFAEVGTVTLHPQIGNPKPRLFRIAREECLFNRMGFNNKGAVLVSENIRRTRDTLPKNFRVGVNIGKNKETSQENAAREYALCLKRFEGIVDYVVINVSSPNTEGLRALQSWDLLRPVVLECMNEIQTWKTRVPLLVKFAPEFAGTEFESCVHHLEEAKVDGLVLSNTQAGEYAGGRGGWSGRALTEVSRSRLISAKKFSKLPIISVGGIVDEAEALARVKIGADLIQIYSSWIYRGPRFPMRILKTLKEGSA